MLSKEMENKLKYNIQYCINIFDTNREFKIIAQRQNRMTCNLHLLKFLFPSKIYRKVDSQIRIIHSVNEKSPLPNSEEREKIKKEEESRNQPAHAKCPLEIPSSVTENPLSSLLLADLIYFHHYTLTDLQKYLRAMMKSL